MGAQTGISWCHRTWSPWYGCTQVSMGATGACVGCYARQISETRMHRVVFGGPGRGIGTRDVRAESAWKEPLRWEREAAALERAWHAEPDGGMGRPWPYSPMVFPSMCDPFDNHPDLAEPRRQFFDLMKATPHLTWLLLTKRPQNIVKLYLEACCPAGVEPTHGMISLNWPRNAAIGFTAVTPEEMDRDSRHALAAYHAINPALLFWSGEPLLGSVLLPEDLLKLAGQFWAITGGETDQGAHKARPTHPDWFRSIRDQCAAAGVPYHHKQNGEWVGFNRDMPADTNPREVRHDIGASPVFRVGKKLAGRLLDGVQHDAMPKVRS